MISGCGLSSERFLFVSELADVKHMNGYWSFKFYLWFYATEYELQFRFFCQLNLAAGFIFIQFRDNGQAKLDILQ